MFKKKIVSILTAAILVIGSTSAVLASNASGDIYKNGEKIGKYESEFGQRYVRAETILKNSTNLHTRNVYVYAVTTSIYSNTGSYSHTKSITYKAGEDSPYDDNAAYAYIKFPVTERGSYAMVKHSIMIDGTTYTPNYTSNGYFLLK